MQQDHKKFSQYCVKHDAMVWRIHQQKKTKKSSELFNKKKHLGIWICWQKMKQRIQQQNKV